MDECDTVLIELNEHFGSESLSNKDHHRANVKDMELMSQIKFKDLESPQKTADHEYLLKGKLLDGQDDSDEDDEDKPDDLIEDEESNLGHEDEEDDLNDEDYEDDEGHDMAEDDHNTEAEVAIDQDDCKSEVKSESDCASVLDNNPDSNTTALWVQRFIKEHKTVIKKARIVIKNKCMYCDKIFESQQYLAEHYKTHNGERPYLCTICNKGYKQRGHLSEHKKIHTDDRQYECPYCCKRFLASRTMVKHMRTHTGEKPYACTMCDYSAAQKSSLHVHMLKHTGNKPHCCPICNSKYWTRSALKEHFASKHPHLMVELIDSLTTTTTANKGASDADNSSENEHPVEVKSLEVIRSLAEQTTTDASTVENATDTALQAADNTQLTQVWTVDDVQGTEVIESSAQVDDNQKVTEVALLAMDEDGMTSNQAQTGENMQAISLSDMEACKDNMINIETVILSSHPGNLPAKTRTDDLFLNKTMTPAYMYRRKKKDDEQMCNVCGKVFANTTRLENHMKTHTDEKPFICPVCGKAFRQQGHLMEHHRIHTGEMPHHCEHCSKKFSTNRQLVKHTRIHTGERPYQCPVCKFAFTQRSSLVGHMRRHTGEKPYICGGCNKKYATKTSLRDHMLKKHGAEIMAQLSIEAEQHDQQLLPVPQQVIVESPIKQEIREEGMLVQ